MHFVKPIQLFRLILLVGLVLLPFIYWPSAQISFEIPRVFFIHRLIEILSFVGLITIISKQKITVNRFQAALIIGYIFYASIISCFGSDLPKSLLGNTYRGDGLITLWRFGGLIIVIATLFQTQWHKGLVQAILLGSIGVSTLTIISIWLYFMSIPFLPPWYGKFGATFGQPHFLAGYLALTFPFLWYLYRISHKGLKPFIILATVMQSTALLSTRSWGAIVACTLGMGILLLVHNKRLSTYFKPILLGITMVTICIGALFWWDKNKLPVSVNAESRQRIFAKLTLAAVQKPIFGWGWANVDHAFQSVDWPYKFSQDVYVDKAHNTILEVLVTTGVIGLLFYVSILVNSFRLLYVNSHLKNPDIDWWTTLGFCLFVFVIHSQTNVIGIAEEFIFWLILAFTLSDFGAYPKAKKKLSEKSNRLR